MSVMCKKERVKVKPEAHERKREIYLRKNQIDILQLGVAVLASQLVRPKNLLIQALLSTVEQQSVQLQGQIEDGGTVIDGVFLYGHDQQNLTLVIKHAIREITQKQRDLKVATIALNGQEIGKVTSFNYHEILAAEFYKLQTPNLLVIILNEFTVEMFTIFQKCGFVRARRSKGLNVITINCVTNSNYADEVNGRQLIVIPSCQIEPPGRLKESMKLATDKVNSEMPTSYDSTAMSTGNGSTEQKIDAVVQQPKMSNWKPVIPPKPTILPHPQKEIEEDTEVLTQERSTKAYVGADDPCDVPEIDQSLDEFSDKVEVQSFCERIYNCCMTVMVCLME